MANGEGRQSYEIRIRIVASRDGDEDFTYVSTIHDQLRTKLRKSGRYPNSRFDSSGRKEGRLTVCGVPKEALESELGRCNEQARDHGYSFAYELKACEADADGVEKNELKEYETSNAEKDEEIKILRRRLEEGERERLETDGRLRMLKMEKEAKPSTETITRTVEVYPLKASMKTLRGYSRELDLLDSFFKTFSYEKSDAFKPFGGDVSVENVLGAADLPLEKFAEFVRKVYGDGLAAKVEEMDRDMFYDINGRLNAEEMKTLTRAPMTQMSAQNYKLFVKMVRLSESEMPAVLTPKNSSKLALYIPKGKSNKGPASKALQSTVLAALENSGLKVESEKHDFVRELQFFSSGERKSFARSLSDGLELEINKVLPDKIGYKIYVANFLED
jgi:hypothetical protein